MNEQTGTETTTPWGEFHACITDLIRINRELRAMYALAAENYTPAKAAMLFGTVRVTIGRQCGQTEYIVRNAKPCDIIIAHSATHADWFRRQHDPACKVIGASQMIKLAQWKPSDPNAIVWVDESSRIRDLNELYSAGAKDFNTTFVLLGAVY